MKVAIVHYWLTGMRGGEKVVEALADLYPEADIFTLVVDRSAISERLKQHTIIPSFLQRIPRATRIYQRLLPLMPFALEHFDMRDYDLVISSESGPAKGVVPRADAVHICYCHSPMRYIWDHYHAYRAHSGFLSKLAMPVFAPFLRVWDVSTAARVDHFVANSQHVANRINRYYRREATVISPPVATGDFSAEAEAGDFYLCAGQLVRYKRADLAVEALSRTGRRLVVIGTGEEAAMLKRMAGPSVEFLGYQPFEVLQDYLARCRALVFPGEEDFGIVPVEAMASGRPVIAFNRGGATETVIPGVTGMFFDRQDADSLVDAIERFEAMEGQFDRDVIRQHAESFDVSVFKARITALVEKALGHEADGLSAVASGGPSGDTRGVKVSV